MNGEGEDSSANPLAFLGLKRVGVDDDEKKPSPSKTNGVLLNRRGVPARKRKKNSLIYGADDLVSIPIRSPRKRGPKSILKEPPDKSFKKAEISMKSLKKKKFGNKSNSTTNSPVSTPKKALLLDDTPKSAPTTPATKSSTGLQTSLFSPLAENGTVQRLGSALRNLLKLPKAHKWVCYEFFYSNLDKFLFQGENDFMVCINESFPRLKTRNLTRVEWCKIRRMMGKPRRCSSSFFEEERSELFRKRSKIRLLQQRKQNEVSNLKDLPDHIPVQLTIGTKVTARLRKPQDGLFAGTVDAFDTSNDTYRITFDRIGLGTQSVPDYEVLSDGICETIPVSTFSSKIRVRPNGSMTPNSSAVTTSVSATTTASTSLQFMSPVKYGPYSPQLANDPLLSGSTPKGKVMRLDGQLGCYPIRFLEQIVRLSKCLKVKRLRVDALSELNYQGERLKSFGEYIPEDFQKKYASSVIDLSNLNRDLNEYLKNIQDFTLQFGSSAAPIISPPNIIRENCKEEAYEMVNSNNTVGEHLYVENPKILALVSSLTALMIQVKNLAEGERNSFELHALQDSIMEIKNELDSSNHGSFQDNVEVHVQHIQSGLSQLGNLHAFMLSNNNKSD